MGKSKDELIKELAEISSGKINNIISELAEIHKVTPIKVKNQDENNSSVCFILSCPGRDEMIHNKLCQGETGKNLNKLLLILSKRYPSLFPDLEKEKYDILNASQTVHFDALDGCTEGDAGEIKTEEQNVKDYITKNKKFKFAILLGEKPKFFKDLFDGKCVQSRHLGYQSINQINNDGEINIMDFYKKPSDRTNARIKVVANEIIKQIDDLLAKKIVVLE